MKQVLFYFLLFVVSTSYCQKKYIDSLDIVKTNNSVKIDEIKILVPNADKEDVTVRFELNSVPEIVYSKGKITPYKINTMIMKANYNAMYSCKNKYTYVPKEMIMWYYKEYEVWDISVKFTAQNDYGATKDGNEHLMFDITGENEVSMDSIIQKKKEKQIEVEAETKIRKRKFDDD